MNPKNEYRIEGEVVWIKLTQGKETCVDLEDWPDICEYRWYAIKSRHTYYAQTMRPGKPHRKILKLHRFLTGELLTDHRDGHGLNNRRSNLRRASHQQNAWNQTRKRTGCSSSYRGVSFHKQDRRWVAHIRVNRLLRRIGAFLTEREAALAYDKAASSSFGEFAKLNFPIEAASTRLSEHCLPYYGPSHVAGKAKTTGRFYWLWRGNQIECLSAKPEGLGKIFATLPD